MDGSILPVKEFDPLNLAESGSADTLAWYRAAELKHGRAAMVATTGFLTTAAGFHFPGDLATGVPFASLSDKHPLEQWAEVPVAGK